MTEIDIRKQTDIGSRVRYYRKKKGISQCELADALAVSPSVISNLEKGKSMVGVYTLLAIIRTLGISIEELFPDYSMLKKQDVQGFSDVSSMFEGYTVEQRHDMLNMVKGLMDLARQQNSVEPQEG